MRLLLLSSSRSAEDETFLGNAMPQLREHLAGCQRIAMIPFAGVTIDWDDYARMVAEALARDGAGPEVLGVHQGASVIDSCDAIMAGGGNSFQLYAQMHQRGLMERVRERVSAGLPYVGWSAGSNLACPGLYTSNDMPIVEPASFRGLDLVPFQINPHFTDAHPPGHRGETRRMRLEEFLVANPEATVVGLPEGGWLRRDGQRLELGGKDALLFRHGEEARELPVGSVSQLL